MPTSFVLAQLSKSAPWLCPLLEKQSSLQGLKEKPTYHRLHLIKSLKATFTKHILRVSIQGWTFPGTLASFRVFIPRWRTTLCGRLSHTVSSSIAELAAIPEAMRYIVTQPPCNRCVFFFSDSRCALESLSCSRKDYEYAITYGHRRIIPRILLAVTLQQIPSHCAVMRLPTNLVRLVTNISDIGAAYQMRRSKSCKTHWQSFFSTMGQSPISAQNGSRY